MFVNKRPIMMCLAKNKTKQKTNKQQHKNKNTKNEKKTKKRKKKRTKTTKRKAVGSILPSVSTLHSLQTLCFVDTVFVTLSLTIGRTLK